jgi:tetratricopeptide (TPR) repeat protein
LIAACVIVYAPVSHFRFVMWDDPDYVLGNAHVARGLTWGGAGWAFTATDAANWHPLTWLSHMLDVQLYGMDAGPQHVTSLLLHILNTLLLFGALYRMTAAWGRSAFVAGLFAAHPLHVESVAWIAERKDVLSTLFWLLGMWAYVSYVRRPRASRYALVVLCFALGLMAKPMLVTLPFALLLLDYWPLGRTEPLARLVKEKTPLFALAAASSVVTLVAQQHAGAVKGFEKYSLGLRAANALASYFGYIAKTLWPARLAALYPMASSGLALRASLGALILVGVTFVAVHARRRRGYLLAGWLWYVGTLIPVIGLVQVGAQAMADRYTYVPLIGLFVMVAWGAQELAGKCRLAAWAPAGAAACALLACGVVARAQVGYWSDSNALWERALAVTAANAVAHNNLGAVLVKQGKNSEAIAHFTEALRIRPDYPDAENNMGMALLWDEKYGQAERYFRDALRNLPDYPDARNNLGKALMWQGRLDEAAQQLTEALRLLPDYADAENNLGMVLMSQGKLDEAARHFNAAIRIDPSLADPHDKLGSVLAREGTLDAAIAQYGEAVRLRPDYAEAHNDLGVALGREGKLDQAIGEFQAALRIRPDYADAASNLKLAQGMQVGGGR